jgi:16S rRNA (adenine1518-N6/adenine1519-N6)-dimethyltransferase
MCASRAQHAAPDRRPTPQAGATVLALEKDYNFADKLQSAVAGRGALKVVQGDALRVNLLELIDELRALQPPDATREDASATSEGAPSATAAVPTSPAPRTSDGVAAAVDAQFGKPRKVKVLANLPYYITTDVLKLLFPMGEHVSHVVFMLQHEVALRLTDPHPGAHLDSTWYCREHCTVMPLRLLGCLPVIEQKSVPARTRGCLRRCHFIEHAS